METVYLPDGLSYKEFINMFSDAYLIGNPKIDGIRYSQTLEELEQRVLSGSVENARNFIWMMAWKMGRIRKDGSLYSGWTETSNPILFKGTTREYELKLLELHKQIIKNRDALERYTNKDQPILFVEEVLHICANSGIKGVGPVYAIAILSFFSHGKYPIYDRFAKVALNSLFGNTPHIPKTGESKELREFNYKNDYLIYIKHINNAQTTYYNSEETNYLNDRKVDRALWVYGHGYYR